MKGISAVIRQASVMSLCREKKLSNGGLSFKMSPVTPSATTTTKQEKTNWNFSFCDAEDVIAELKTCGHS